MAVFGRDVDTLVPDMKTFTLYLHEHYTVPNQLKTIKFIQTHYTYNTKLSTYFLGHNMMSSTFLLLLVVNPFLCPFSRLHRVPLHSPSSILPLILFNSMLFKLNFSKKQRKKI